jgi:hypothetical protein
MRTPHPRTLSAIAIAITAGVFACTHAPQTATGASSPQARATQNGRGGGRGDLAENGEGRGGRGGPPGGGRKRRPPNWEVQDSIRRATVAEVLAEVAGRENEPAGKVFKNVKLLKQMPVTEFLKTMDESYGRGLGYTCSNCHVDKDFANDTKKGKVIARQMQVMTTGINQKYLSRIKEMDDDYQKATCVSCHKSTEKVNNKMDQPTNAPG